MARRSKHDITLSLADISIIASADKALLAIINGLLVFLEGEGLLDRDDFLALMDTVVLDLEESEHSGGIATFLGIFLMLMREEEDGTEKLADDR